MKRLFLISKVGVYHVQVLAAGTTFVALDLGSVKLTSNVITVIAEGELGTIGLAGLTAVINDSVN